jgi:hypothetical protein
LDRCSGRDIGILMQSFLASSLLDARTCTTLLCVCVCAGICRVLLLLFAKTQTCSFKFHASFAHMQYCMAINQTQSVRLSPSRSYPQATSSKGPSATKRKLVALAYAVLIQDDGQVLTGLVELLLVKTYDSRYYGSYLARIEYVPLRDGIN